MGEYLTVTQWVNLAAAIIVAIGGHVAYGRAMPRSKTALLPIIAYALHVAIFYLALIFIKVSGHWAGEGMFSPWSAALRLHGMIAAGTSILAIHWACKQRQAAANG